jgi:hypothetical protein
MTTLKQKLECLVNVPGIAELQSPWMLAGICLDRRSRPKDPTAAALLAADLVAGDVVLYRFTPDQAIYLTGTSWRYFWTARELTSWERCEIEAGRVTLSALAQGRRKATGLITVA